MHPIYLDYAATTPLDARVLAKMLPFLRENFGNAGSAHAFGRAAAEAVQTARHQIADAIGADAQEIIFTSGATEANNLAILGMARFYAKTGGHIVAMRTEHKAVIDPIRHLESLGWQVTWVQNPAQIPESCRENTKLITLMWVNNELGSIHPIAQIAEFARSKNIYFHVDAAQAFGKIPIDLSEIPIDSMAFSGHKIYGPKGIGALFVRRSPRPPIQAVQFGGGQERGLRSGTLAVPLIVGFGAAAQLISENFLTDQTHIAQMVDIFWQKISQTTLGFQQNQIESTPKIPNILNIQCPKVHGESLHALLDAIGLAVSAGSACNSARGEASYVLRALGLSDAEATASVRIAFGRMTTRAESENAAQRLVWAVCSLQNHAENMPTNLPEFAEDKPNLAQYSPEVSAHFWQYLSQKSKKTQIIFNKNIKNKILNAEINWMFEILSNGAANFEFEAQACPSLLAGLQYLKNHINQKHTQNNLKNNLKNSLAEITRENLMKNLRLSVEKSACALVIGQIVREMTAELV